MMMFNGKRFILDPIDGTTNLLRSYKQCSISLGYYADNQVKFGVVFNPFTNEMFFAIKGKGAHFFNTRWGIDKLLKVGVENYKNDRLSVSNLDRTKAIVEFGAGSTVKSYSEQAFNIAKEVFANCMDLRRICSSALSICYIAAGRIDGYFEFRLYPWDYAAAKLILEESGGKISHWNGKELDFINRDSVVAGNKDTYDYLLSLLKKQNL